MVGTPYYMAPECIRGHPYDWSSDVWSLGCLLYEMAAMRSPFWRVSSAAPIDSHDCSLMIECRLHMSERELSVLAADATALDLGSGGQSY